MPSLLHLVLLLANGKVSLQSEISNYIPFLMTHVSMFQEVHAALRSRWKSSTDAVLEAVQSHSNQRSCSLCIGALQDSFLRKCGDMVITCKIFLYQWMI